MDDNRIIIDSANFNRNMPKWATEDTLSRLERMIGNNAKSNDKALRNVVKLLKDISKENVDLFRDTEKSNKEQIKELRKITKTLDDSNKASSRPTTDSGVKKAVVDSNKKTKESVDKGFSDLTVSSNKIIDSILDGNDDLSSKLETANKLHEKVAEQLLKVHEEISNLGNRGGDGSGSSDSGSSDNPSPINVDNTETNNILGEIKTLLGAQNEVQNKILDRTVSSEDFDDMMNRNTRRITDEYRDAAENSRGSLRDMFNNAMNANRGESDSILSGVFGTSVAALSKTVTNLGRALKSTPLGRLATVASMAYGAATKSFEYAYDTQDQFRGMIDKGFNFGELAEQEGPDRLDGISMRATILENDIGLETATKILENNTRLINEVGIASMFTELGNVIGNVDDPNSVTNRLGMTRDQVAEITTDFYAMRRRVNNLTRDMTQLDRQDAATRFVENVRMMSQQLGVGVPQIREAIQEFSKSDAYKRSATFFEGEQADNFANYMGMLNSLDIDDSLKNALREIGVSQYGIGSPMIGDDVRGNPLMMSTLQQLARPLENIENLNPQEQLELIRELVRVNRETMDSFGKETLKAFDSDPNLRAGLAMAASLESVAAQIESDDVLTGSPEEVSREAVLARELENLGIVLDARMENVFAQAADTAAGRDALYGLLSVDEVVKRSSLELVGYAQDISTALFTGPIPSILNQIKRVLDMFADTFNVFGGNFKDAIDGGIADIVLSNLENNLLGTDAFDIIFETSENEDGQTVYNISEGIQDEQLLDYFSELYKNADSKEDRGAIVGILKSLGRGLEGDERVLSDEASKRFSSMEDRFVGMASQLVAGTEEEEMLDIFSGSMNSLSTLGERIDIMQNSDDKSFWESFWEGNDREGIADKTGAPREQRLEERDVVQDSQSELNERLRLQRERGQRIADAEAEIERRREEERQKLLNEVEQSREDSEDTNAPVEEPVEEEQETIQPEAEPINESEPVTQYEDIEVNIDDESRDNQPEVVVSNDTSDIGEQVLKGYSEFTKYANNSADVVADSLRNDSEAFLEAVANIKPEVNIDNIINVDRDMMNGVAVNVDTPPVNVDVDENYVYETYEKEVVKNTDENVMGDFINDQLSNTMNSLTEHADENKGIFASIRDIFRTKETPDYNDQFQDLSDRTERMMSSVDSYEYPDVIYPETQDEDNDINVTPYVDRSLSYGIDEAVARINTYDPIQQQDNDDREQYTDPTVVNDRTRQERGMLVSVDERPDRYDSDMADQKEILEGIRKRQESEDYSRSVAQTNRNANSIFDESNGFGQPLNQNGMGINSNNEQQSNDVLLAGLSSLESTMSRIADAQQSNTRALNEYLNRQV